MNGKRAKQIRRMAKMMTPANAMKTVYVEAQRNKMISYPDTHPDLARFKNKDGSFDFSDMPDFLPMPKKGIVVAVAEITVKAVNGHCFRGRYQALKKQYNTVFRKIPRGFSFSLPASK